MQSGYGVSEMQQFMVDGICSQFFPLPPATTAATSADLTHKQQQEQQQVQQQPHPFLHHHHQQQQQQFHHFHQYPNHPHHLHFQDHHPSPPPVPQQQIHHHQQPPRFPNHFHHPIPITQQLFQQNQQFHLFQQEQQRRLHHHHHLQLLHPDPQTPENSASSPRIDVGIGVGSNGAGGGISSFLGPSMNFRLSVNENSGDGGGDSRDGLNDDNGLLQRDEVDGSEERRWPPPPPQSSREEDDSAAAIKEPFWRPLDLDLEYINRNNNKCFKEKRSRTHQEQQQEQEFLVLEGSTTKVLTKEPRPPPITIVNAEDGTNSGNNYKLFSELEAICKPGTNTIIIGNNSNNNNHQTGSSSALTGDNPPTSLADPSPFDDQNADEVMDDHVEQTSDTSTGEGASLKKATTTSNLKQRGVVSSSITKDKGKRSRRRRKRKQELRSIVAFLETLVKQLMDHQETLHRKFIEALEMKDQQRMATEEAWRQQEATKSMMESKAREERHVIAAAREAEIVSFLERITGESLNLSTKPPKLQMQMEDDNNNINAIDNNDNDENHQAAVMCSNRWPKAEVQALIRVRSGLETRFQEPGLKGPLWEEVSSGMAAIGYRRSAKRCKEKWENINKYFRKTKENAKRRSRQSKTCPYFHQLDQLYSKSTAPTTSAMTTTNNDSNNSDNNLEQRGNSELLDAIVVSKNDQSGGFNNYSDNDIVVVPLRRIEFDTSNRGDGLLEQEGGKDDDDDEGEGESLANSSVKKGEPDEEDERMEESNLPII